jgi:hypothetical protein
MDHLSQQTKVSSMLMAPNNFPPTSPQRIQDLIPATILSARARTKRSLGRYKPDQQLVSKFDALLQT